MLILRKNNFKTVLFILFSILLINCKSRTENKENLTGKDSVETKIDITKYDRSYNDIALWLAGLEQDSSGKYKNLENSETWKTYSVEIREAFNLMKIDRLGKLDTFTINELSEVNTNIKTLFYPYSGPDFTNANIFFPKTDKIIMAGLERVGDIPDFSKLSEINKQNYFSQILESLTNILTKGYFITKRMKKEFAGERLDSLSGVIPIFYVFMAQANCRILDAQKIYIDTLGNIVEINENYIDDPFDNTVNGLKIDYIRNEDNKIRTVIYFSHDLGEFKHADTPEFLIFLKKQNINVTFLKAASYLNIWFGIVRNFILDNSDYIFQDDSGIPIKYINDSIWNIKLYGTYTKTLDMFKDYFQSSLKTKYAQDSTVVPLNFGIGYNGTIGDANLQLFTKKK